MQFEIEYDNGRYLVAVEWHIKDERNKVVFFYGPYDEYEITLVRIDLGNGERLSVTDMPQEFQAALTEILEEHLPKSKSFVANPFFDELYIFYGLTVYTPKEHYRHLPCDTCQRHNLFELQDSKQNKTQFVKNMQDHLRSNPHPDWPFKDEILLQISVSDTKKRLKQVDIDNLSKSIIDGMKGIVFEDDTQIAAFAAHKESVLDHPAYIIGVRRLSQDEKPKFEEFLFSGKQTSWHKEYQEKNKQQKLTRFLTFN